MDNKISVEEFSNFGQTGTLAYNLASHECEVDSSKQEILFNSLVSEKHIEGNLRMWDMAKFLSQEMEVSAAQLRSIKSSPCHFPIRGIGYRLRHGEGGKFR